MDASFFPANSDEAIAFLYVTRNCSDGATPEELQEMYAEAYKRIRENRRKNREASKMNFF